MPEYLEGAYRRRGTFGNPGRVSEVAEKSAETERQPALALPGAADRLFLFAASPTLDCYGTPARKTCVCVTVLPQRPQPTTIRPPRATNLSAGPLEDSSFTAGESIVKLPTVERPSCSPAGPAQSA